MPVTESVGMKRLAYARYRGEDLPSAYHWTRAGLLNASSELERHSNFSGAILPATDESAAWAFGKLQ